MYTLQILVLNYFIKIRFSNVFWVLSNLAAGDTHIHRGVGGHDTGEFVDPYVLWKCSASIHIISAKDHASIQINVTEVDLVTGWFNGKFKTYAICRAIRRMVKSDDSVSHLVKADGIVSKNF